MDNESSEKVARRRARSKLTKQKNSASYKAGMEQGFRSGLESKVFEELLCLGIRPKYEEITLTFTVPEHTRKYTPDFILPGGMIIETKGRFLSADRKKMLLVRDCNPSLDIRFVFSNPNAKLAKSSKTSYSQWCEKHGFRWASKSVPLAWLEEDEVNFLAQERSNEEIL